ncbi:translation initiation factor IF-2 associated domain-containing protein, partial [Photobacterium damselae subsp. damselae]|nr:translation initiation factor IF-2 associated domain-containing protein [Photobacterium damselae subsp. damselae]
MSEVTVKTLADEIGTPIDRLLQQLSDAGIAKKADDNVSQTEKQTLLSHLQKEHGGNVSADGAPTRLTLQRKTRSTLSVSGSGGKNKSVQVEVRKKRTYVKRSALEEEQRA